jgi:hypothetical protein
MCQLRIVTIASRFEVYEHAPRLKVPKRKTRVAYMCSRIQLPLLIAPSLRGVNYTRRLNLLSKSEGFQCKQR